MTNTLFIRLLQHGDKGAALAERIEALREGRADGDVYAVDPESFRQVPNTPFCYWVSERIRRLFKELPPFEGEGRTVKQGLATADDFRFVRAWWEVPAERILDGGRYAEGGRRKDGEEKWTEERVREFQAWCRRRTYEGKRWAPFAKGGEYSPYYADIHLVVNWEKEGAEIRNFIDPKTGKTNSRPQNTDYYFRPGLTWPRRSYRMRSAPVPAGSIFSHAGMMAFAPFSELLPFLGLIGSAAFDFFVRIRTGSFGGSQFEVGLIQQSPVFSIRNQTTILYSLVNSICSKSHSFSATNETSYAFLLPTHLQNYRKIYYPATIEAECAHIQTKIDQLTFDLYKFTEEERKSVNILNCKVNTETLKQVDIEENEGESENEALPAGRMACRLLWCVGVVFGRWDVRIALDPSLAPKPPDPFDPLPVCPPGMLVGPDGLPAEPGRIVSEEWLRARPDANSLPPDGSVKSPTISDSEYPLRISWDGILVDDPEHPDDIVRRVREVLEVLWKDRSEAIEKEACDILGVRELRDYFRKPAGGGFWMDHVKRYSKSRRKAPIYWYLRSARGSYGLWLYYHRLDKDILFKALLNYVEPKIRLEEDRLNALRARREAAGKSGREAKALEKEIDRQEQFVAELQDFRDKLRRAANLHLDFDLNDGVILNMAPLWELVPWNEPKKYWEELGEGKYDWSHIALQLWPDRVKEKCRTDRSIAIAHGLEHLCEIPPPKPKRSAATAEKPEEEPEELEEGYTVDEAE